MLGEDPGALVASTIENFETDPDLASLNRINETMKQTELKRKTRIDALEAELAELQAMLDEKKQELDSLSVPDDAMMESLNELGNTKVSADQDLFKIMNNKSSELDSLKVSLAKQLSDLESTINQMNMTKLSLIKQKEELTNQKELALTNSLIENRNSSTMKISLYRLLGVHIEPGQAREGETANDKVIMFNRENNLTSILELDEKYSDYFISNYIWDRLG